MKEEELNKFLEQCFICKKYRDLQQIMFGSHHICLDCYKDMNNVPLIDPRPS